MADTPAPRFSKLGALYAFCMEHELDYEALLMLIAEDLRGDAERETHPLVKSCLESAAEHAQHAALDWYCSTK